jgi:hypothetical protein
MLSFKRKAAIALLGAGAVTAGGFAYATWSASGSGSGNAKALTAVAVTVTAATGAADLYPGFSDGDVHFTLTNTNPYPITFTGMTAGAITSSDPTNCPSSHVTVDNATGLSIAVAAGGTNVARSIADVVNMASGAPDGCQGVTFTIALTLAGTQS